MDRWILHLVNEWHGKGILLYVLITTVSAGLLSAMIGIERQLKGEAAGVRTHALIAIASSLLMTISIWAIRTADGTMDPLMGTIDRDLSYDTSRIAAAAVTGIGFLGGGVIVKEKFSVRGLATAATLWICTSIGLACGAGFVSGAVITTAVVITLSEVIRRIDNSRPKILVKCENDYPVIEKIRVFSEANGLLLKQVKIISSNKNDTSAVASFHLSHDAPELDYICHQLENDPKVYSAKKEKHNGRKLRTSSEYES